MFGLYNKIKEQYTKWLRNMSTKHVIVYSVIFIVFIVFVLPWISDLSYQLIQVKESIDASFFTEIKDLYLLREEYGAEGRKYYILLRITFDVVWPIVYFLFFASITACLSKNITNQSTFRYINYLPLIAVLLDFIENGLAIIFMLSYPSHIDFIAFLLIVVSINKWVWIGFTALQIIWLSIKRGVNYVRK